MDDFIELEAINRIWAGSIGPDASMLSASQHIKEHCAIRLNTVAKAKIKMKVSIVIFSCLNACCNKEQSNRSISSMRFLVKICSRIDWHLNNVYGMIPQFYLQ